MVDSGVYEFINKDFGKALNMWGEKAADGVNVNLYAPDHSGTQRWRLVPQGNGTYKLACMADERFVLDRWRIEPNKNNADIYTSGKDKADNDDQTFKFTEIFTSDDGHQVVRIQLASDDYYLSAVDGENGTGEGRSTSSPGNVYFNADQKMDGQVWLAVLVK